MQLQDLKEIASSTNTMAPEKYCYLEPEYECLLPFLPGNGARKVASCRGPLCVCAVYLSSPATAQENSLMSTGASILVDSVGPPRAEVCRTAASFP